MPRYTTEYTTAISVLLNEQQKAKVSQVAEASQMKVGPYLRRLIDAAWDHKFGNKPTCADASSCRCSNLHTVTAPPPTDSGIEGYHV